VTKVITIQMRTLVLSWLLVCLVSLGIYKVFSQVDTLGYSEPRAMDILRLANGDIQPSAGPAVRQLRWIRDYCGGSDTDVRDVNYYGDGRPITFQCEDWREGYVPRDI